MSLFDILRNRYDIETILDQESGQMIIKAYDRMEDIHYVYFEDEVLILPEELRNLQYHLTREWSNLCRGDYKRIAAMLN